MERGIYRLRWTIVTALAIALLAAPGASAARTADTEARTYVESSETQAAKRCPYARLGVAFYRARYISWQIKRGASIPTWRKPRNCADARYLANLWAKRSLASRRKTERYLKHIETITLDDSPSWRKAVREVQAVFPGTESWLLSCADAEGWNLSTDTRWVIYGGGQYYPGAEHSHNGSLPQVGGPLQYMWGTFKGHFRNGLQHVLSKGYRVPEQIRDPGDVRAWRSMLAQAIAGGWARFTGNDNSHWSASWGRGC